MFSIPGKKINILIVYKYLDIPLRTTIKEHLYSFLNYGKNTKCYYLKLDPIRKRGRIDIEFPDYLKKIPFDIIFFHYGFISSRWAGKENYLKSFHQVECLVNVPSLKVVLPQDEYMDSRSIVHFINHMKIDMVFSVAPESEWKQLYEGVDFAKVRFHKVLTGYLDDRSVRQMDSLLRATKKDIDIGYRARNLPQWLGRHGYMKSEIAGIFKKAITTYNLVTDISIDPKDTFMGSEWFKFMARCKYMIGVEGGATVHDSDGAIAKKGRTYLDANPDCSFEEIENACFPELDGKLQLIAISPRHLEACASRTCQLLLESTYNGILIPNRHYIEIKKDFSNLSHVLDLVKKDSIRKEITDNAYNDIVLSGRYSYRVFVDTVVKESVSVMQANGRSPLHKQYPFLYLKNRFADWLSWKEDHYRTFIRPKLRNRWFYIILVIDLLKWLHLKDVSKKLHSKIRPGRIKEKPGATLT